jgi:enamine deaminase RidA (YjgF/YER057c/UK114 family)
MLRQGHGMQTITHDPTVGIYATTPDYVHAVEVRAPSRFLFVAGTMGLNADGTPPPTLAEQLDLIWRNLRTVLAAAGMTVDNVVRVTSYLRDASFADSNGAARVAVLGGRAIPTTAVIVETLSPGWLVEIELIAAA